VELLGGYVGLNTTENMLVALELLLGTGRGFISTNTKAIRLAQGATYLSLIPNFF
jgi:hypothetical protein